MKASVPFPGQLACWVSYSQDSPTFYSMVGSHESWMVPREIAGNTLTWTYIDSVIERDRGDYSYFLEGIHTCIFACDAVLVCTSCFENMICQTPPPLSPQLPTPRTAGQQALHDFHF